MFRAAVFLFLLALLFAALGVDASGVVAESSELLIVGVVAIVVLAVVYGQRHIQR